MKALEFSLTTLHLTLQTITQSVKKHINTVLRRNNNKLTLQALMIEAGHLPQMVAAITLNVRTVTYEEF